MHDPRSSPLSLPALPALLLAFLPCACTAPAPPPTGPTVAPLEPVEVAGVRPLHRVGSLWLAGQPDRAALAELRDAGVELVIDLRAPEEPRDIDEPAVARELGLEHVVLPVASPDDLSPAFFDGLRALLDANEGRGVLLHCGSSNRVGAAWLAARTLDDGVPWGRALAEARASGLRTEALWQRTRDYVRGPADRRFAAVRQEIAEAFPDVPTIGVAELAERIEAGAAPILIDVREPEEFAVSHLPRASRATTIEEAFAALDGVGEDAEVVVYCSVGYRSAELARALRAQGFERVRNLTGSIFEWANEGHVVVRDGARVERVHPYDDDWGELLDPALRAELR